MKYSNKTLLCNISEIPSGYEPAILFKLHRKEKLESHEENKVGEVLSKQIGIKE